MYYTKTPVWKESSGIITYELDLQDAQITGLKWISRVEAQDFVLKEGAKDVLRAPLFQSLTEKLPKSVEVVVYRATFFKKDVLTSHAMRSVAKADGLSRPLPVVACASREQLMNRDLKHMGLTRIIFMHKPIKDLRGIPYLLTIRHREAECLLTTYNGDRSSSWRYRDDYGFAWIKK